MDAKNTLALTVGLGALGTLLAYYGYNNLNNDPIKNENFEAGKETQVSTTDEQRKQSLTRCNSPVNETSEENVKLTITDIRKEKQKVMEDKAVSADSGSTDVLSEKKVMKDSDKWKQYWKKEYASTNQTDAADYN